MKPLLAIFLLAGLLAGCSAATGLYNVAPATPPVENPGSVNPNEDSPTGASPTGLAPTQASPLETAVNNTSSNSTPKLIKVKPPMLPIGPASTPAQGWQTFTSTVLGVAVDYPGDWSVTETDAGVTFKSPQGLSILLQADKSGGSASTTGQDCTTLINSYGQAGDICLDAATFTYRAVFIKSAEGSTAGVILSVISQEKPTFFYQMFDSLRFAS